VLVLRVGGREIESTAEHPFWVRGKGWTPARLIGVGDELTGHQGGWVVVEGVDVLKAVRQVYNLRVADHHTYFVGRREWGFSVWAHNAYSIDPSDTTPVWHDASGSWLDAQGRPTTAPSAAEIARKQALGVDPATGRYRLGEEQAASRLELLTGRLQRDPSGAGDWIDASGTTYDAVGPAPANFFNETLFNRQIDLHLTNKVGLDFVVVDLTGLSPTQVSAVMRHINGLSSALQKRIIVQPW
jgi:hypothetical protein